MQRPVARALAAAAAGAAFLLLGQGVSSEVVLLPLGLPLLLGVDVVSTEPLPAFGATPVMLLLAAGGERVVLDLEMLGPGLGLGLGLELLLGLGRVPEAPGGEAGR
jgi:hypothetical protein